MPPHIALGIEHVPLLHTSVPWHVLPMQHGCPIAPQVMDCRQTISPATIPHVRPGSQALPQQGWSIPPQGGGD
jgi:hypothetical protein